MSRPQMSFCWAQERNRKVLGNLGVVKRKPTQLQENTRWVIDEVMFIQIPAGLVSTHNFLTHMWPTIQF